MPSPNAFAGSPRLVCHVRPVRTVEDAASFARTQGNPIGTDPMGKGRSGYVIEDGIGRLLGSATITQTAPKIGSVEISLFPAVRHLGYDPLALRQLDKIASEHGITLQAGRAGEETRHTEPVAESARPRIRL